MRTWSSHQLFCWHEEYYMNTILSNNNPIRESSYIYFIFFCFHHLRWLYDITHHLHLLWYRHGHTTFQTSPTSTLFINTKYWILFTTLYQIICIVQYTSNRLTWLQPTLDQTPNTKGAAVADPKIPSFVSKYQVPTTKQSASRIAGGLVDVFFTFGCNECSQKAKCKTANDKHVVVRVLPLPSIRTVELNGLFFQLTPWQICWGECHYNALFTRL